MEKDANKSREDKHFNEDWYERMKGSTYKIPYSVRTRGGPGPLQEEHRKQIYLEWKRAKTAKTINKIAMSVVIGTAIAYVVTMLGFRI